MQNTKLDALVSAFVSNLRALMVEEVTSALSGAIGVTIANPSARSVAAPAQKQKAKRGKGQKRSPEELTRLTSKLATAIAKNPGLGIEKLGKLMGESTAELFLPAKKLLEAGTVSTKGQRRATRYYPKNAR